MCCSAVKRTTWQTEGLTACRSTRHASPTCPPPPHPPSHPPPPPSVARGLVVLATSGGSSQLAVAVVQEEERTPEVALTLTYLPQGAPEGASSLREVSLTAGSTAAVPAELQARGLTPVLAPSDAQLAAALPVALWGGVHVSDWRGGPERAAYIARHVRAAAWRLLLQQQQRTLVNCFLPHHLLPAPFTLARLCSPRPGGLFLTIAAKALHCYQENVHYLKRDSQVGWRATGVAQLLTWRFLL